MNYGVKVSLGEIADLQVGFPFKSKNYSECPEAVKLVRGDNVVQGSFRWENVKKIELKDVPQKVIQKYSLALHDVTLAMDRPWIAAGLKYSSVSEDDLPCLLVQRVCRLRAKDNLDQRFLKYIIGSAEFTAHIKNVETGTAVPHISQSSIAEFSLNLPSLQDQKAIAHILGTLDDKIELNQKMNQTLEEIAKAIFKSWFVDFDPVRAKAEGRPTGLPSEISDLFPDELVDSEVGEIPKGWVLKPIYDLADFINGAAYKKFEPNRERLGLPIIKIAELKSGVSEQTGFSTVEMGEKYLIRQKDILFSWSGNPDTSIDTFVWQSDDAWLNQHIFKVIPTDDVPRSFLLQLLRSKKPVFTEIARNKQTTGLGHVTVKDLKEMLVALPELGSFNLALQSLETIQDRVFLCEREILILAELRDTLLPKLISGELRIPDAEKFLEVAGI